ncbi:MAG: restriction endonuclease subunit S, partial [Gammaproteobacteria bacterium]|nr:restriction endonuclease subunit S [Gammaproteobacteria bacterium]
MSLNYSLPEGWYNTELGTFISINSGNGLTKKKMVDGEIPVFGGNGITGWHNQFNVDKRTIVIGRVGYYCGSIHLTPQHAWITDNAFITHYSEKYVSTSFLFSLLIFTNLRNYSSSSAQPVISGKKLYPINVLLPPLAEQKEIASRLDNLLAQVDTLKNRLDTLPTLLKHFRQSVLVAAVSGKLTKDWRIDNNIKLSSWNNHTIGDVSIVATGKTPKRSEDDYWNDGDVPWLTSSVTGKGYCTYANQFVTKFAVKDCSLKMFKKGTLLLAMYGEGKTRGQVTELMLEATCNQACAAITANEDLAKSSFIKLRLLENYEETRKAASGGNQPNLNLKKVRNIPINVPTLEEQTEIVTRVETLFAFA